MDDDFFLKICTFTDYFVFGGVQKWLKKELQFRCCQQNRLYICSISSCVLEGRKTVSASGANDILLLLFSPTAQPKENKARQRKKLRYV